MKFLTTIYFFFLASISFSQIDSLDYKEIYSGKNNLLSDERIDDLRYLSIDVIFINSDIVQDQIEKDVFGKQKRIKIMQTDLIVNGLGSSNQQILFPVHFANLVSRKNPKYYKREYSPVFENVPRSAFQSGSINAEIKRKMTTGGTLADVKSYVESATNFITTAADQVAGLATSGMDGGNIVKIGSQIAAKLAAIVDDTETSEKTYSIRLHDFKERDEELVEVRIYRLQKKSELPYNTINSFPTLNDVLNKIIPDLARDTKHGYVVVLTKYRPFSFSYNVESQIDASDEYLEKRITDLSKKELSNRQRAVEDHFQLLLTHAIRLRKELELYDDKVSNEKIDTARLTDLFLDYYTFSSNYHKYKYEDNYYLKQYDALFSSMNMSLEKFRRYEFNDRKRYIELVSEMVNNQNYVDKIDDMRKSDLEKNLENLHFIKSLISELESPPSEQISNYRTIIHQMEGKLFSEKYQEDVKTLSASRTLNNTLRESLYNSLIECTPYCYACSTKISDALFVYDANLKIDSKASAKKLYDQLCDGILKDIEMFDKQKNEIEGRINDPNNQLSTTMLETIKISFDILKEDISKFSAEYSYKQFNRIENPTIEDLSQFNSAYTTFKSKIEDYIKRFENIGFVSTAPGNQ